MLILVPNPNVCKRERQENRTLTSSITLSKEVIQGVRKTLASAEKSINMLENKNQLLEDIISAKEEKFSP
ncbi:unnamed protein product [Rhizophagus irregularis]|uniref:Uncharacterized protein n=1 Tax=Rhizophagus irregularis TaxID=588596 RepID=A0A2I1GQZ4_9GLOM|nr:hypothetical protein RhiirA4_464799 [Rhizophagus irregularis]CAB4427189.1 unnamed protein product [Rhizophagus irregularis]